MSFFSKSLLSILSLSVALVQPISADPAGFQGCFSSVANYTRTGAYIYQSDGYCVSICKGKGQTIAATQGELCACGQSVPSAKLQVADDQCETSCPGYPYENCGGNNVWSLYNVAQYNPYSGISIAAAATSAAATQSTVSSSTTTSFATSTSTTAATKASEVAKGSVHSPTANATSSASNDLSLASPIHAIAASILTLTAALIPFVLYI